MISSEINGTKGATSSRLISEFNLDLSLGKHKSISTFTRFGFNPAIVGTREDIWASGSSYPWPTTAETIRVKSGGNAADTAAGAGAQSIMVQFLDANWELQEETLALAGSSASAPTTLTARRVIRAWVYDVGTYTVANTADIVIENTTSNQVLAVIAAGTGQTTLSQYTVPTGKVAYLRSFRSVVARQTGCTIRMLQRQNADDVATPFTGTRVVTHLEDQLGSFVLDYKNYPSFPAKTDLWCDGIRTSGSSDAAITVIYDLLLVDENY